MAVIAVAAVGLVAIFFSTGSVKLPTQRLGELSQQTAKEGEPIPIIWGTAPPMAGNLLAVQEPPRIERRKQKSGGKGGGSKKSTQTIEVPRRTYALGICEGPGITLRRAWRNNKLVYDGRSGSAWGARNNRTFLSRFRFYGGSFTQMPDANLESIFGVGNVPAMRGLAYMVALDEDLQDTGGAVPQWQFEVVRPEGLYLTSWIYPIEVIESGQSTGGDVAEAPSVGYAESGESLGGAVLGGSFASVLEAFSYTEAGESLGGAVLGGTYSQVVLDYSHYAPEELESQAGAVLGGDMRIGLIKYERYAIESLESKGGAVIGGTFND